MKTFFSPVQLSHDPQHELSDGKLMPAVEIPARAENVLTAVKERGLGPVVEPEDFGLDPVFQVHDRDYVTFLQNFWDRWCAAGRSDEAFPFVWPVRGLRADKVPSHIDGQIGYYSFDAGTPLGPHTFAAARASANSALGGADALVSGQKSAFALCRPPGHHAAKDCFGGYCFFNNAAVAAQYLRDNGSDQVSILDIDYHHGNGTQSIFYDRSDVQFVSIHADPADEYPYFLGNIDEKGAGTGEGYTLNYPLPIGTAWPEWSDVLAGALACVDDFRADSLVVSLGLDPFVDDPISQFKFTADDFKRIGEALARISCPTLFVLEGGYAVEALGTNCVNVLSTFEENTA